MKSISLIVIFITFYFSAFSQFNIPGQKLITGEFNALARKDISQQKEFKSVGTSLDVSFGKFTKENHLRNFKLMVSYYNNRNTNQFNGIGVSSSLGYECVNIYPLNNKLFFGLAHGPEGGVSYAKNETGSVNSQYKITKYFLNYSLDPKLYYQLNKRLVVNLSMNDLAVIGGSYNKQTQVFNGIKSTDDGYDVYLNTGLFNHPLQNLGIGFSYLFNKK